MMNQGPVYIKCCHAAVVLWIAVLRCSLAVTVQDSSANCPTPKDFPNGYWSLLRSPRTVFYHCNDDYSCSGPQKQLCVEGIGWDPPEMPTCVADYNCSAPESFPHGSYSEYKSQNARFTKLPRSIYFYCNEGFHLVGEGRHECLKNGTWNPSQIPVCTAGACMPAPDIANAEYTGSGIEVTYRCNPEYRMENPGNNKLVCRDGQWTGTWPSCVLEGTQGDCPKPKDIRNGRFTAYEANGSQIDSLLYKTKYWLGQRAKYSCNYGYRLIGDSSITCNYWGWSGSPPYCVKAIAVTPGLQVKCPALSDIMNGICVCETKSDITECAPFYLGQHVECTCDRGYKLSGESILTCKHSGVWDFDLPRCVKGGVIDTTDRSSKDDTDTNHMSTRTLVIVVATACSVLGVLLLVMVIMVFRRHKPRPPSRLCRASATPPPYSRVHNNSTDELDRYLMIGYENPNENAQASLPSYEEAMASSQGQIGNRQDYMSRSDEGQGQVGEYRPLPSIPSSYRANQMMTGENTSRHSIITTSTMNRDGVSELFGSIDTVNVSVSDASTAVTIETLDSATSHHSNMSRRATAGSIASDNSNENLATEDVPLLESSQREDNDKSDSDDNGSDRNE